MNEKIRILVVDDDESIRRYISKLLTQNGYDVRTASNGKDAVNELRTGQDVSLAILDILMPEMDGLAALDELRQDPVLATIPVILLSARGQMMTAEEATARGAALFLTKPFSPTQLLKEAQRLIGPGAA